jgi:divalent metal cation (Fe/Co/Zn/Cd) transporter
VDLHIVVNGKLSVREGHSIAPPVEDEVLRGLISEVLVHVEPEEELENKQNR